MNLSRNRKTRVLHIASGDLWAGAEVQLHTLLSRLHERDDTVVYAALMNKGELAKRLRTLGIAVTVLDESRLNSWQILKGLRALMKTLQPDVIHTHRIKENILGALANLTTTRATCVRTVHGASEHPPRGLSQLHKQILASLDTFTGRHLQQRIIAVSQGLQAPLAQTFGRDKVVVIENGIDIAAVQAAIEPVDFREQAPAACHIGIVGRLQAVKRIDIFLDMAARLIQTHPEKNWRFHVIGDGPLRTQLQQQASSLDIAGRVTFHGHRRDSVACVAGLDALVMCSDHEGMPMTLLEAVTAGTPVLAHAVGGMVQVLENHQGGLLVSEHNPQAYAAGLLELLALPKEELRAAGQAHVRAEYAAEVNADKVSRLYREII
jgi:glycosyltransferase involved in cell wall biosynthesis